MLQVIIHDIKRKSTMEDHQYKWLLDHLGLPLKLATIDFDPYTGDPWMITVYTSTNPIDVRVLFINDMGIKYTFIGELQVTNR